jgi:hypothetical protein
MTARERAARRYYAKHRRAIILCIRIRRAGLKAPTLTEARRMLGL